MRRRNLVSRARLGASADARLSALTFEEFDKQKHTPTEIGVCFLFLLAPGRLTQAALRTFARA
jgi:hypothetical protein